LSGLYDHFLTKERGHFSTPLGGQISTPIDNDILEKKGDLEKKAKCLPI
jgi:hypothetical protein